MRPDAVTEMLPRVIPRVILFALLAGSAPGAGAAGTHPLAEIRDAARTFLLDSEYRRGSAPTVEVRRLDSRLRVTPCDGALEASLPAGARAAGNTVVAVRCTGSTPWTVHVAAAVRVFEPVVVLARPLSRGETVTAAHLRREDRDVMRLFKGYYSAPETVVGMGARRSLAAGYVLNPGVVEAPRLIRRGQRVTLLSRVSGLEVRSVGTALGDASGGDLVRVRNLRSSRIVEGVASGEGTVEVKR